MEITKQNTENLSNYNIYIFIHTFVFINSLHDFMTYLKYSTKIFSFFCDTIIFIEKI